MSYTYLVATSDGEIHEAKSMTDYIDLLDTHGSEVVEAIVTDNSDGSTVDERFLSGLGEAIISPA